MPAVEPGLSSVTTQVTISVVLLHAPVVGEVIVTTGATLSIVTAVEAVAIFPRYPLRGIAWSQNRSATASCPARHSTGRYTYRPRQRHRCPGRRCGALRDAILHRRDARHGSAAFKPSTKTPANGPAVVGARSPAPAACCQPSRPARPLAKLPARCPSRGIQGRRARLQLRRVERRIPHAAIYVAARQHHRRPGRCCGALGDGILHRRGARHGFRHAQSQHQDCPQTDRPSPGP